MKKRFIWTILATLCAGQTAAQDASATPRLAPTADQAQTAYLSAQILGRYHYKTVPLDDAMSEKIFDRYLKSLDPERLFFTQADIDSFADARTRLDDAILRGNLAAPFAMFQRYEQRVTERLTYAREQLGQGFDFTQKEAYAYARDKAPWPADEAEVTAAAAHGEQSEGREDLAHGVIPLANPSRLRAASGRRWARRAARAPGARSGAARR